MTKRTFKEPKTGGRAPKNNVLGQWGRSQQPSPTRRPGSVTDEEAREQDSPLDYAVPKKRGR